MDQRAAKIVTTKKQDEQQVPKTTEITKTHLKPRSSTAETDHKWTTS